MPTLSYRLLTGSRKLQFLKSSPILLAYIALLGLILVCRI